MPTEAQKRRDVRPLRVFGRLTDGTERREAQAEMSGIAQQLRAAYPEATRDLVGLRVETFTERYIGGGGRPMLMTVMGAVVFVLLIACANVANLLLSRSAYRAREIAVRTAMGATRWRVVRQLLIESVVLAFIGGSIGLLLAIAGVKVFAAAMQRGGLPYWVVFSVDYVVFAYVAAICLLTAVLFGLAPALHVSKTNHSDVLKEGGRGSTGHRRVRWFSSAMVVTELALTVVLLAGAGLMIRSFMTLYAVDIGIKTDRLMTMRLQLPESKYPNAEARRAFFERLEPRLAAIPGVEAAAVTTGVPSLDGGERLLEIDDCRATREPIGCAKRPIGGRRCTSRRSPSARGSSRLSTCRSFADGTSTTRTARPDPRRSSSTRTWRRDSSLERTRSEGGSASRNGNRRRARPRTSGARSSASAGGFCTARPGPLRERGGLHSVPPGVAGRRIAAGSQRAATRLGDGRRAS